MSWSLYRWAWRLETPLSIGLPPSGSLNRCRLYVPARNLWAAMTAEFAQRRATRFPAYAEVGEAVRNDVRLTYLFPAEETDCGWRAWLPRYERGRGLVWQREDDVNSNNMAADRGLRSRLLLARPGTAIDHLSATADDGTLRETECIGQYWREPGVDSAKSVAMVGYAFVHRAADLAGALERTDELFLGGDTRYGLGRVRRVAWDSASDVFGISADIQGPDPCVTAERVLAHASVPDGRVTLSGDLEMLAWWDYGQLRVLPGAPVYWRPGSVTEKMPWQWSIQDSGLWTAKTSDGPSSSEGEAGR